MDYEIKLAKEAAEKSAGIIRAEPPPVLPTPEANMAQKRVRQASDNLMDALMTADLGAIAFSGTHLQLATAGNLVRLGLEPTVEDLVNAARQLIDDARVPAFKGIAAREWDQVRVGSVMVEIVVRGIFTLLQVPYKEILDEVHKGGMQSLAGQEVTADIVAILRAAGHEIVEEQPQGTDNDTGIKTTAADG